MAQVSMLSDEWLSRYGLLENFNARMVICKVVLHFNLQSHPLAWTQEPDAMERKLTLQGIYGPSMNAF